MNGGMLAYPWCIYIPFACLMAAHSTKQARVSSKCQKPLGLESGNITNAQFEAEEHIAYKKGFEPWKGRLNGKGCYCTPDKRDTLTERWYEGINFIIHLREKYVITGLGVQKGYPTFTAGSYMKFFTYDNGAESLYNGSNAIKLPELRNDMTKVYRFVLEPSVVADKVKIQLQGSQNHNCIRMELYGCLKSEFDLVGARDVGLSLSLIVVIVLVVLLLVLFALLCYRYRRSLCKEHFQNKKNYYDKSNYSTDIKYLANEQPKNVALQDEQIYSDIGMGKLSDSEKLLDRSAIIEEAYNDSVLYSGVPDSQIYAEPGEQYVDTDDAKRESLIYYGSAIYGTTYENPYKSILSSSIYAEPDKPLPKGLIREIPRSQLKFREIIGVGQFGEVHICEASGLCEIYGEVGHTSSWGLPDTSLVAVKVLKSTDDRVEHDFMQEVEVMAALKDENVVRLLGICTEHPKSMVVEYMENGDLNEFLQGCTPDVLTVNQMIHMSQQISDGMKYLHSLDIIHRDLATRNCLVGPAYNVKIADFGMSRDIYSEHYYRVEGKAILPIRWMAPECLYYGKFTMETDVWSFGVTLWEVFSFAADPPYSDMMDQDVIEAACQNQQNNKGFPYLRQSPLCPDNVYDLVMQCWAMHPRRRPSFELISGKLRTMCTVSELDI